MASEDSRRRVGGTIRTPPHNDLVTLGFRPTTLKRRVFPADCPHRMDFYRSSSPVFPTGMTESVPPDTRGSQHIAEFFLNDYSHQGGNFAYRRRLLGLGFKASPCG